MRQPFLIFSGKPAGLRRFMVSAQGLNPARVVQDGPAVFVRKEGVLAADGTEQKPSNVGAVDFRWVADARQANRIAIQELAQEGDLLEWCRVAEG